MSLGFNSHKGKYVKKNRSSKRFYKCYIFGRKHRTGKTNWCNIANN